MKQKGQDSDIKSVQYNSRPSATSEEAVAAGRATAEEIC